MQYSRSDVAHLRNHIHYLRNKSRTYKHLFVFVCGCFSSLNISHEILVLWSTIT